MVGGLAQNSPAGRWARRAVASVVVACLAGGAQAQRELAQGADAAGFGAGAPVLQVVQEFVRERLERSHRRVSSWRMV